MEHRRLLWALLALLAPAAQAQQPPIRIIFDTHADPVTNALPVPDKIAEYHLRLEYLNWALDAVEPYGVQISFLSSGWFMEVLHGGGPLGPGAVALRRIYDMGGQIGSHTHNEHRAGFLDWPSYPSTATYAECLDSWQDNIDWVDQGILTAFAGSPPESLADINCVKGAHLPKTESDYHAMMSHFGMQIRQPGPEEDYYGWYGHHIWHPFRPSTANYMAEDLSAPFVQVTQGSVVGRAGIHHGVLQDMSLPAMKRQFLQLYLNWRHRDRLGAPPKIWTWGWGSHPKDFAPGGIEREALMGMVEWLDTHFAAKVEPSGSDAMIWSNHREAAEAYFAWETANPGISSFSFDSLTVDWDEYPWLRPVAEEMQDFHWLEDLSLGAGVQGFRLRNGIDEAILLWRDTGSSLVDLSGLLDPTARVVALESGLHLGDNSVPIPLGGEPIWVTELERCTEPVSYCTSTVGSSGVAAHIDAIGSTRVADNDFALVASGLPAHSFGIFFSGRRMQEIPFWDGYLCIRGPLTRLAAPAMANGAGVLHLPLDLPSAAIPIVPGSVWNFQAWFRDPGAGGTGANTTDGVNVRFCP